VTDTSQHAGARTSSTTALAFASLLFMVFFLGASAPLGIYAYQSGNEVVQAFTILSIPLALWGWIRFLRKALWSIDLTLWSLPTTKGSIAAGLVTLIALIALLMTQGSSGLWLAMQVGASLYVLALLILNYHYTRSVLLTLVLTVTHVCISTLFVLFAIWLYVRLQPPTKSEPVDSDIP
jgi:hypothetical protein